MNSKLTDELSGFYAAYSAWVNAGAQPGKIFGRANGLCVNAYDYFSAIGVDSKPHLEAMHAAFVAAGLDEKLPFNASPKQYAQEQRSVGCYLNPARLAWVASALQERRKADSAVPVAWSARDVRNDEMSLYSLIDDVNAALSENQYLEVTPLSAASPAPVVLDAANGLMPCPFCGGKAHQLTIEQDDDPHFGGDVITCTECGASSHVEFGFKENLKSAWNSRVAMLQGGAK